MGINTLDGGADIDTADYSLSTKAVVVSLAIGVAQAVNSVETDTLTNIENLTGSAFDDTLTGNAGNNALTGGLGADHLNGGGGSDSFVYASAAESTSTTRDVITGFDALSDNFDLTFAVNAVDAEVTSGSLGIGAFRCQPGFGDRRIPARRARRRAVHAHVRKPGGRHVPHHRRERPGRISGGRGPRDPAGLVLEPRKLEHGRFHLTAVSAA